MSIKPEILEQQFARLADLPREAQVAALQQLQNTDPELAKRLAGLLEAHASGKDPLDKLPCDAMYQIAGFDPDSLLGRQLGDWTLERLIGRGGMGVVYQAHSVRDGIRQQAAVKLLAAPLFDQRASERFVAEARALARLDHPGICRLRDWGHSEEGWPYLVLDLVPGEVLSADGGNRRLRARLQIMARIADAVAAAHQQLVLHLDLKPANVVLGENDRPVLLDFGVARILGDDPADGATLTRWLTPRYASPEQLRGEPLSAAADVYALGVMLYEQVTGAAPFQLKDVAVTEALRRIEQGPTPPSRARSHLPRDLDAICARAMHPEPARRYASAAALAEDLRALIDKRPVSARPDSLAYRLSCLLARHPLAMTTGTLAVLAVTVLAMLLAVQAQNLKRQRDRAEREAGRARAVTELLISSIKAADPTSETSKTVTLNQLLEATSRRIHLELANEPEVLAEGLVGIGNAREAMGQHGHAIKAYDEAIGLMDGASFPMRQQLEARLGKLDALRWSDNLDAAIGEARTLMAHVGKGDQWRVQAALGALQVRAGDAPAAEKSLSAAIAAAPLDEHARRANILNSLASSYGQRGELKQALAEYDRALSEFDAAGSVSPDLEATIRLNRAKINSSVGDGKQALADINRAVAIRRDLFGEKHYLMVQTLGFRSIALTELGRYDEAIAAARKALAIERDLPGGGHTRQTALQLQALGGAQLRAEKLEAARDSLNQALQIYLEHLPPEHPEVAAVRNNLAAVYNGLGDHRRALGEMLKVWDAYRAMSPDKPTVYLAMIASNVADAYAKLGQGTEGVKWSRRSLQQAATTLPPDHWIVGNLHSVLASNLLLTGDLDGALSEASAGEQLISGAKSPVQPSIVRENLALLAHIHAALGHADMVRRYRDKAATLEPGKGL